VTARLESRNLTVCFVNA